MNSIFTSIILSLYELHLHCTALIASQSLPKPPHSREPRPGTGQNPSQQVKVETFRTFRCLAAFTTLGNSFFLPTACLERLSRMTLPQNSAGQWLVCTGNDVDDSSPTMSSNDNAPSPLPADGVSKRKQGMYFTPCSFSLFSPSWGSRMFARY